MDILNKMSFLIGPLLGLGASLLGSALKGGGEGARQGVKRVNKPRELIVIHEGELVAPKKLANKLRRDPKYKKDIAKLPKKAQRLSKADKMYVKNI